MWSPIHSRNSRHHDSRYQDSRHQDSRRQDSRHRDSRHHNSRSAMTFYVGYNPQDMEAVRIAYEAVDQIPGLEHCADGTIIVGIQPTVLRVLEAYVLGDREFDILTRVESHNVLQCIVEAWTFCQLLGLSRPQKLLQQTGRSIYHGTYGGRPSCPIQRTVVAWNFVHANFGNARMHVTDFIVAWTATACRCDRQELSQLAPDDADRLLDYLRKKQAGGCGFNTDGVDRRPMPQQVNILPPGALAPVQRGPVQPPGGPIQQGPRVDYYDDRSMPPRGQCDPRFPMEPQSHPQHPASFHNLGPEPGFATQHDPRNAHFQDQSPPFGPPRNEDGFRNNGRY